MRRLTGWLIHQLTCARAGNYGSAVLQSTSPIAPLHARQCCADDYRYTGSRRIAFYSHWQGYSSVPFLNLSNPTEDRGVSNQEDIICQVHGMDFRELLGLIVEHPFFLTDNYFIQIRQAVRTRYAELTSDVRTYYSF